MANLLSTIIDGFISSRNFVSGLLGSGWRINNMNGKSKAEFDDIVIRNTMTVFELLISKIRAIKGALGITQASGKIKSVRSDDNNFYIEIEDEMSFVANDIIRCMEFNSNQRSYWVIISAVDGKEITVAKNEFNGVEPQPADELVQFGNTTDTRRQSAIYLHADENGQPSIDVLFGINSKIFDGCTKIRIGGDIPGTDGLRGFYCENGMVKGVNEAGELMYCLYPDGQAYLGAGSAIFRPDKSGHIAGGAISWQWDETKKKYVCTMGDVILTWENLSPEVQENIKGENGQTSYLHIKYSNDGGLTFTANNGKDPGAYMGTYVDFNTENSNDVSNYKWNRIKGEDANLLPWVEEWNKNSVTIGSDNLVSPRIFSGIWDEVTQKMTGVALGRNVITVMEDGIQKQKSGIFGMKDGEIVFSVEAETRDAIFKGKVEATDGIFHGKVYATDGEFTGIVHATDGEFTGLIRTSSSGNRFEINPGNSDNLPSFQMISPNNNILSNLQFISNAFGESNQDIASFRIHNHITELPVGKCTTILSAFGLKICDGIDNSPLGNNTVVEIAKAGVWFKNLYKVSSTDGWHHVLWNRNTGEIAYE